VEVFRHLCNLVGLHGLIAAEGIAAVIIDVPCYHEIVISLIIGYGTTSAPSIIPSMGPL